MLIFDIARVAEKLSDVGDLLTAAPDQRTYDMPLTIRIPAYDETMSEIEDGGYVTMREAADTPATQIVTPPPATVIATPPPATVFDDATFPLAPPRLVRQRAIADFDELPIRTLLGDFVPTGEPLEGFGQAPVIPDWANPDWANGQPPFEPNDLNNPINPNRFAMM